MAFPPIRARSSFCPTVLGSRSNFEVTPSFFLGALLVIVGSHIRRTCYHTLGRLFTFEMAIRQGHSLVIDGPYAYVRHPAYTGLILAMLGQIVTQGASGSWLCACGWTDSAYVKVYFVTVIGCMMFIGYGTIQRGRREDAILKEKFGNEWIKWAQQTPYRMIPYIY